MLMMVVVMPAAVTFFLVVMPAAVTFFLVVMPAAVAFFLVVMPAAVAFFLVVMPAAVAFFLVVVPAAVAFFLMVVSAAAAFLLVMMPAAAAFFLFFRAHRRAVEPGHIVVVIFMVFIKDDIEIHAVDAVLFHPSHIHGKSFRRYGVKNGGQFFQIRAEIDHGAHEHVSADAGRPFNI